MEPPLMTENLGPASPNDWRATLRQRWEVIAALLIMIAVLSILDVVSLHDPELALASVPVLFLLFAALVPVQQHHILGLAGACGMYAVFREDWRFAALAYSAFAIGGLQVYQRSRRT
jgi:hypothetical protein